MAHYNFTRADLANIMQVADDVYESTRPASASVAAMSLPSAPNPHNDLSHKELLNQAFTVPQGADDATAQIASLAAQVAAMQKKFGNPSRGNGRGGRGRGRGGNRGGGQQPPKYSASNPRHTGPRHPDWSFVMRCHQKSTRSPARNSSGSAATLVRLRCAL